MRYKKGGCNNIENAPEAKGTKNVSVAFISANMSDVLSVNGIMLSHLLENGYILAMVLLSPSRSIETIARHVRMTRLSFFLWN